MSPLFTTAPHLLNTFDFLSYRVFLRPFPIASLIYAMVNPGGFSGLRKKFLDDQQAAYNAAVEGNHSADTLADIQRRYFKRFPVTISHSEDPTEEFLGSVDDDAPDPELSPPDRANMECEGYDRAQRVYELQVAEIKMRKAVRYVLL